MVSARGQGLVEAPAQQAMDEATAGSLGEALFSTVFALEGEGEDQLDLSAVDPRGAPSGEVEEEELEAVAPQQELEDSPSAGVGRHLDQLCHHPRS